MNFINIEPKDIIITATKIKIDVISLELNVSAIIRITLYDNNTKIVQTNMLILNGEDYQAWQTDDDLLSIICDKYNYQLS
jgi:hypothetical protein